MARSKQKLDADILLDQIAYFLKSQDTPAHFSDEQQARQLQINLATLRELKSVYGVLKADKDAYYSKSKDRLVA